MRKTRDEGTGCLPEASLTIHEREETEDGDSEGSGSRASRHGGGGQPVDCPATVQPHGHLRPDACAIAGATGSGSLVQVDAGDGQRRYGVLTCGHVLGAFEQTVEGTKNESLTLLIPNNGSASEGPPWSVTIRYQKEMAVIEGARNEDGSGPDLAWLPLTRDQAHTLQNAGRSGAVFYNLTTGLRTFDAFKRKIRARGTPSTNEIIRDNLFMAVGWNREIHARSDGTRGGIWMTEVTSESVFGIDGWEYADFRINDERWKRRTYDEGTEIPSTWKGLSGGAVWHVWRPEPSREEYAKILTGVVFYEMLGNGGRTMSVRVHHELSVLRLLHRARMAPAGAIGEEDIVAILEERIREAEGISKGDQPS